MTNVSKKNTNEPRRKRTFKNIKNIKNSEQSGGAIEDLKSVFIEDITGVWQNDTAFNTRFFSSNLVTTIVDRYTANLPEPEKKIITKHSDILTIGLDPNIQTDLFIWGANLNNHDTPFDAPLNGSGQAGKFAPYKKDSVALSHPNYLGIITTQYDRTSTTEQVIADINQKFDDLESYVRGGGKVHIPRDHTIFEREKAKINTDAETNEIQDSFETIQMGLGAGLAKDQQDSPENYIIQQDLLYYRVAKLSVLSLKDKLDHINEFLTIYAGKDKVKKGVPYYSETQLFLPKEITDSLKLKVKETGFKNRLFSAVLILPKTYLKTDNTYIPKIKQHLLFRHPIHYGPDDKWNLIDENKFTEIFGCSKRLIYEFNAKVRGKLRTTNNETKVCPGDLLIEHLWYGILGWTDWVYSDSDFTKLSDESPKKNEKDDYDTYRPTKDGAYILHTWGVNLENNRTPHYKFCFSDLGDGKKKITDTLVYSKPNETFHENNYKKLLNNMLNVIQNAITHLTKKYENKKIQVRISKLGFGAWKWMIPPERRKYLLDYYKDSLLKMHIDDRVVITFLDYENGMCLTSEKNPENSKLQWSKNKTGPYNTDPFGPFIGNDNDVLLLVNAWDDASFIGNGGSLDPTLDGWMVTGDVKRYPLIGLNEKLLGYYAQNYSYFHNVFFQPQLLDEANWIGGEGINIDTAPVKLLEPVKHASDGFFAFIADRLEEGANVEKEQAGKKEIKKDSPPIEPLNLYERLIKEFDKVKHREDAGKIRVTERSQKKVLIINDLLKKKEGDTIEALVQIAKNIDEKSKALNTALDNMDAAEEAVAEAEAEAKPHREKEKAALAAAQDATNKRANDAQELRDKVVDLRTQFAASEVGMKLKAAEFNEEQVRKKFYKSFNAWGESIKEKMKEVVEQLLNAEPENQMVIDLSAAFDIKRKEEADPNRAAAERAAAERAAAEAAERARAAAEGDGKGAAAEGDGKGDGKKAAERVRKERVWWPWRNKQPKPDEYQQQAIIQENERARSSAKYYQEQAEAIARGFKTSEEMAQYIKEKQIYIGYEYDNEYTHVNPMNSKIETISNKDFLSELDTSIKQLSEEIEQKKAIPEKIKPDALSMAILQAELIMMKTKMNLVTADIKKKLEPEDDYVQEVYVKIANIKDEIDEIINAHHIISVIDIAKAMGNNAKEYDELGHEPMNVGQAASLFLKNRQEKIIELADRYKPDHGDDANKILEALLISFEIKKDKVKNNESYSLYKYNQEETTKNPQLEAVAVARGFFTLDEMNSMLEEVISEKDILPLYENINNYYDMIPIYVKTTKTDLIVAEMEQLNKSKIIVESAVARVEDPAINNAKLKMMRVRFEILRALLIVKGAYENENEEGLMSAIQSAFELQFLLWKETILIAREIGDLKLDEKLTENIKLKVKEMITKDPALTSNSILLGLKQAFNFEDPIPRPHVAADINADINAAVDAAVDADIDEAVVNDPMLGAQYIVAAKRSRPNNPIPEFDVKTWLARVNDAHKYIAEAEFEAYQVEPKYKQEWVEWRAPQLKPDWKNIYNPELWEEEKKKIDVKLEQKQRQQVARPAAELQEKIARPVAVAQQSMLDKILKVVSGDARQAVAQQVVARPAVAQQEVAQPVVARPQPAVVAAANAQRFQQDARQAEMHVSSIYQEDNSSSYMFYIPIVGILIGISSMFLIK
jgi:hypothetical protein